MTINSDENEMGLPPTTMQLACVAGLAVTAARFISAAPEQYGGYGVIPQGYGYDVNHYRSLNRWGRCDNMKLCFTGFSNVISNVTVPHATNVTQYVPWNSTDSNDWAINCANSTELVARNEGVWNIIAKLQLILPGNRNFTKSTHSFSSAVLDGFLAINGIKVAGSDSAGSVSTDNQYQVLVISMTRKFRKGDRLHAE